MILCSRLKFQKVKTAVLKRLGIFLKNGGGSNNVRVSVKTVSSATIIVYLVYSVMWCGVTMKCDNL